jgi:hypothetical protein
MDLYMHFPIRLNGVVLINTGTALNYHCTDKYSVVCPLPSCTRPSRLLCFDWNCWRSFNKVVLECQQSSCLLCDSGSPCERSEAVTVSCLETSQSTDRCFTSCRDGIMLTDYHQVLDAWGQLGCRHGRQLLPDI